jgi:hypothetical protein
VERPGTLHDGAIWWLICAEGDPIEGRIVIILWTHCGENYFTINKLEPLKDEK